MGSMPDCAGLADDSGRSGAVLAGRAAPEHARAVRAHLTDAAYDPTARLLAWPAEPPPPTGGRVLVVCAGTSDLPVAREALLVTRHLGRRADLVVDVGVAGLHRVLGHLEQLRSARAIVVVAGMDGALPSVVAGLVTAPVVAVPTSVGYGAAFEGLAALLTMLNSCAPGVAVVNIDNGYGAGHLAAQITATMPPRSVSSEPCLVRDALMTQGTTGRHSPWYETAGCDTARFVGDVPVSLVHRDVWVGRVRCLSLTELCGRSGGARSEQRSTSRGSGFVDLPLTPHR